VLDGVDKVKESNMIDKATFYAMVAVIVFAPLPAAFEMGAMHVELSPYAELTLRVVLAFVLVSLQTNLPLIKAMWRYRHIPGPVPLPFLGNFLSVPTGNIDEMYGVWEKRHGPVFKWFMGTSVIIVTSDVSMTREVGLKKFSVFTNRKVPVPKSLYAFLPVEFQGFLKYGIFTATGKYWKGIRSTSASIFHSVENLDTFTPFMKEIANELTDTLGDLKEGESIDIWRALGDMTLDVIGSTVFGVRFNSIQNRGSEEVKAARAIFANGGYQFFRNPYILLSFVFPPLLPVLGLMAQAFPTRSMQKMRHACKVLSNISESIADEARALVQRSASTSSAVTDAPAGPENSSVYEHIGENFTRLFVQAYNKETGNLLSKKEITAQAFAFVLAGYETTANTLANTVYLLTKNKDKEAALLKEIDRYDSSFWRRVNSCNDFLSVEELKDYEYVEAVVKEALRMYGPVPNISRNCSSNTQIKNMPIYKDTEVHCSTQNMHWNPEYFPNPEKFMPERFIPSSPIYKLQNHQAFMAFGIGPRMCVASNFAVTEAKLALITLYRRFTFTPSPGYKHKLKMTATLSPENGVKVLVHHR